MRKLTKKEIILIDEALYHRQINCNHLPLVEELNHIRDFLEELENEYDREELTTERVPD